jgi:hypothetical protein
MAPSNRSRRESKAGRKLREATEILKSLRFGPKQSNETAGYVLLALLDLDPSQPWSAATGPLRGITPIIEYLRKKYRKEYAPNSRETIRDEAVKYFVEQGLLLRNPDKPDRPTNSGQTVYQVEASALTLIRTFETFAWQKQLAAYLSSRTQIKAELERQRNIPRIPVKLSDGTSITLSPGGQNPLIKSVIEGFCPRYAPGASIAYIGDAEDKFLHLDATYLNGLGIVIAPSAKMPDVIAHDTKRDWLLLIEAVVSAGTIDAKRRQELKTLFSSCRAGLVFVTAFESRDTFGRFQRLISWETEVWIAAEPDHVIHFNGVRFLGPYPDAMPMKTVKRKRLR